MLNKPFYLKIDMALFLKKEDWYGSFSKNKKIDMAPNVNKFLI